MTTVTVQSSKPPITLSSGRGITITIDRSVTTSSGGGTGTVTSVTGTAPVVITGTPTTVPNVTISASTTAAAGSMSAADKLKLDGIGTGATVTGVTGTAPISSSGGAAPVISIAAVTTVAAGSMSSSDKSKLDGIGTGATVTGVTGTAPIASSGGAAPVISIAAATTSAAGSLSSVDKTKLDALSADVAPAFIAPSAVKAYGIPGLRPSGQGTAVQSMDRLSYEPWFLETSATLDRLAVEVVTTPGSAGKVLRIGIYNANTSWVPTTLVVDAGTVAVDSTGIQAATINVTLPAGRYICAWVLPTTGTAPTLRQIAGTVNYYPNISGTAGNPYQVSQYLAGQGGLAATGLPSTATAPDVYGAAGTVATANFHVRARWA